jgi:hypothetical protein
MAASMSGELSSWIPVRGQPRRITTENDILEIALGLAADRGDPRPTLIQHTRCSRAAANRISSGAVVPGDRESYLIAIQGRFTVHPRRPPTPALARPLGTQTYAVMVLIVDVATGAPTDSGFSNEYPDLAAVRAVVTDHDSDRDG